MEGQRAGQNSPIARHSFVVRIWQEKGSAGWRGWVQHAQTGESVPIQDPDKLLAFFEGRAGRLWGPAHKGLK